VILLLLTSIVFNFFFILLPWILVFLLLEFLIVWFFSFFILSFSAGFGTWILLILKIPAFFFFDFLFLLRA
jgi:hypothetical protein